MASDSQARPRIPSNNTTPAAAPIIRHRCREPRLFLAPASTMPGIPAGCPIDASGTKKPNPIS